MKKIVLTVNDDGTIDLDGNPVESAEDALEQVKISIMPKEGMEQPSNEVAQENDMPEGEMGAESEMPEEEPMESEDIGKTLESKMPMMDKDKRGMRPRKKASFEDYGL